MITSHGSRIKSYQVLNIGMNIRSNIYTGLTLYENTIYNVMQSVISYSHGDSGVYHPST